MGKAGRPKNIQPEQVQGTMVGSKDYMDVWGTTAGTPDYQKMVNAMVRFDMPLYAVRERLYYHTMFRGVENHTDDEIEAMYASAVETEKNRLGVYDYETLIEGGWPLVSEALFGSENKETERYAEIESVKQYVTIGSDNKIKSNEVVVKFSHHVITEDKDGNELFHKNNSESDLNNKYNFFVKEEDFILALSEALFPKAASVLAERQSKYRKQEWLEEVKRAFLLSIETIEIYEHKNEVLELICSADGRHLIERECHQDGGLRLYTYEQRGTHYETWEAYDTVSYGMGAYRDRRGAVLVTSKSIRDALNEQYGETVTVAQAGRRISEAGAVKVNQKYTNGSGKAANMRAWKFPKSVLDAYQTAEWNRVKKETLDSGEPWELGDDPLDNADSHVDK